MKRKKKSGGVAAVCQLRCGDTHPFGGLRGFVPLGGGEERVYREMREAIPVLDAAVGKMVRLCGGFQVKCANPETQKKLNDFLEMMPCGRGQHSALRLQCLATLHAANPPLCSPSTVETK